MPPHKMRLERDSMGELEVPAQAYYGGNTRRAELNFPISNLRLGRSFIKAIGQIKQSAAFVNLDLGAIDWLESWLDRYKGAFVVISHDRTFLKRLTRTTLWLDRGNLRRKEVGFGGYEAWEEQVYAEEARAADKLDAKLKLEAHWLERGVTARRKRNQGRLEKLGQMRAQRASMITAAGTAKLQLATEAEFKSKSVIAVQDITKSYGEDIGQAVFTLTPKEGVKSAECTFIMEFDNAPLMIFLPVGVLTQLPEPEIFTLCETLGNC